MQRHGWTFCFGLLVSGIAAAQPPADLERYPPAPDLPGIVVGQTKLSKPITSTDASAPKVVNTQADVPAPRALEGEPIPTGPTITATTQPVDAKPANPELPTPLTTASAPETGCKVGCCAGGCWERVMDWMCFRSHARQSGCNVPKYRPGLYAWFLCDSKNGSCPSGKCGVVMPPVVVPPPGLPMPASKTSAGNDSGTRQTPTIAVEPNDDLPDAVRVDTGLRFSPGTAPMANQTTQVERVSTWRPK